MKEQTDKVRKKVLLRPEYKSVAGPNSHSSDFLNACLEVFRSESTLPPSLLKRLLWDRYIKREDSSPFSPDLIQKITPLYSFLTENFFFEENEEVRQVFQPLVLAIIEEILDEEWTHALPLHQEFSEWFKAFTTVMKEPETTFLHRLIGSGFKERDLVLRRFLEADTWGTEEVRSVVTALLPNDVAALEKLSPFESVPFAFPASYRGPFSVKQKTNLWALFATSLARFRIRKAGGNYTYRDTLVTERRCLGATANIIVDVRVGELCFEGWRIEGFSKRQLNIR